jgi:putative membrane protein
VRFLSRAFFLLVAAAAILFAISNRETVTVGFWPLPFLADLPLYLLCLLSLLIGGLIGAGAAWIAARRYRRELRSLRRRIAALERELTATQSQTPKPPSTIRSVAAGQTPAALSQRGARGSQRLS